MTNTKIEVTKKAGPFGKISVGLINASIWKNTNDKGSFYNVTFENRYRDKEGNWNTSHSYGIDDLLPLAKLIDLIHTKVNELRNADMD